MTEQKILNIINCHISYVNSEKKDDLAKDISRYYKDRIREKEQKILELEIEIKKCEAKLYAYEKIIANSNFRTIVDIQPMEITSDLGGEDDER